MYALQGLILLISVSTILGSAIPPKKVNDKDENGNLMNRTGRAYGNCNGGRGQYVTYSNDNRDVDNVLRSKAALCMQGLQEKAKDRSQPGTNHRWGCFSSDFGQCKCTADSSYIWNYMETFNQALANLERDTDRYRTVEAERYEGNMYLTYTCWQ